MADAVYNYDQTWDSIEETVSSLPKTIDDWIVHTPLDKQGQFFGEIGWSIPIARAAEVAFTRALSAARWVDDVVPDARGLAPRRTGARILDRLDPDDWDVAEAVYRQLRNTTDDIDDIVSNSGQTRSVVERVKNHLFHKTHLLDDGVRRFDADPEVVNAWQRLRSGTATDADLLLFRHEHAESIFEQLFGGTYRRAHDAIDQRWPSGL